MTPPGQGQVRRGFHAILRIRERVAADPGLTLVGDDIARRVELGAPLVLESGLQVFVREQLGGVLGGLYDVDAATHRLDLLVGDRIEQVLDHVDVRRRDHVAWFDLALGVGLDMQQFIRIGLAHIAPGDLRPQRSQHAGAGAYRRLLQQHPPPVVEIILPDAHGPLSWPPTICCGKSLLKQQPLARDEIHIGLIGATDTVSPEVFIGGRSRGMP